MNLILIKELKFTPPVSRALILPAASPAAQVSSWRMISHNLILAHSLNLEPLLQTKN